MKKIIVLILLMASSAFAYMNIALDDPMEGLRSNSIIEIVYDSSGIWLGTAGGVSYLPDGDSVWQTFTATNGLHSTEVSAMAFSIYAGDTILCVATLHTEYPSGESVPFGDGYSITYDKGNSWVDDSLTYPSYANYFGMLSYDVDMYQNDIYSANFYGGLVRSGDGGHSYDNLFLNASDSIDLVDSTYGSYDNRYFSVKVDRSLANDTISVWGGSAAGLNRFVFTNYDGEDKQDSAWQFAHDEDDIVGSLPGDHIVGLAVHGAPGKAYDAFANGNYIYVAHGDSGLRVIDVNVPDSAFEVGSIDTPGRAWAVYADGNYAYIADYYGGLFVADISDPTHPTEANSRSIIASSHHINIDVDGNYAYLANDAFGMYVYDISSPSDSLPEVATFTSAGGINDIKVQGNYAYLADGDNGLVIIDISNMDSLYQVSQFEPDDADINAVGVCVDGDMVFIADANSGVVVVDVTDRADPQLKDTYDAPGTARGIYCDNDKIYLADESNLHVFEMASPTQGDSLEFLGNIATDGTAINVMVYGNNAFVADNYYGTQIIDISNPAAMDIVGNAAPICSTYIWAACRVGVGEDDQRYGVAYTTDYGRSWTTVIEESAWDFAFKGDTVVVATDNGLYISGDYNTWENITEMAEYNADGDIVKRYFPSGVYAVETVGSSIWAGGADGTIFTNSADGNGDRVWQVYRSELDPSGHFAYPSPFSPVYSTRQGTTIHYMPPQTTDVTIKIFDFNLDLVATVANGQIRTGGIESDNDVWDGRNDQGELVANGIYFYEIKLGTGEDWWGKVAVVK